MTDHTYTYLLNDAQKALESRRLSTALAALSGAASLLKDAIAQGEVEQMVAAYDLLLSYFSSGAEDPSRQEQYEHLIRRGKELLSRLKWVGTVVNGKGWMATRYRQLSEKNGGNLHISQVDDVARLSHCELFDLILLSPPFSTDDVRCVMHLLDSAQIIESHRCLIVSALTLACLNFYDAGKLRALVNVARSATGNIGVRAFVGVVLVLAIHHKEMDGDDDLGAQAALMLDEHGVRSLLESLQMQLFLSLDTKNIDRRINEEIIPEIYQRIKEHRSSHKFDPSSLEDELNDHDLNPTWSNLAKDSRLKHFFKDFVSLQQKGADLYMGTFRNLCPKFRFFDAPANWFYPFTFAHPELPASCKHSLMTSMMLRAEGLGDTDKFAFCLMSNTLSASHGDMLSKGISPELLQSLKNTSGGESDVEVSRPLSPEECMRYYVQSLYRFFHIFAHRAEMVNPFQHNLFLGECPILSDAVSGVDSLLRLADFALDDHSYNLANQLFGRIPLQSFSAETWQKKGFCLESLKQLDGAIRCYEKALDIQPGSAWVLRRLAVCLRKTGRYAEAELYLLELEKICPDDTKVAMQLAECFMQEGIYDEAFKRLYKADYLQPDNEKTRRALAWCSLLAGNYPQAGKYYSDILEKDVHLGPADYQNAGHAAWLCGHVNEASKLYLKSIQMVDDNDGETKEERLEHFFDDDREMLLRAGIGSDDVQIMCDLLGRLLNNPLQEDK